MRGVSLRVGKGISDARSSETCPLPVSCDANVTTLSQMKSALSLSLFGLISVFRVLCPRYGSEPNLRGPFRVHGVYSKEAQKRRSASQRSSMARLAAPKGYNEGDPIGTRRQGDWLRKSRG